MDYLPEWADIATKDDLDVLAGKVDESGDKVDGLAARFDACATKEALDALAAKIDASATKEALDALVSKVDASATNGALDTLAAKIDALATKEAPDGLTSKVDALGLKVDVLANDMHELTVKVEECATKPDLQIQLHRTCILLVLLLTAFLAVIELT